MLRAALLRKALALKGFTPASGVPDASAGRADEATIQPARLIEGRELAHLAVGAAETWPATVAFLDGVQRSEIVNYDGATPVLWAQVAAAVRERRDRRLSTIVVERREYVVARPAALERMGALPAGMEPVPLNDDGPPHPVRDLNAAQRAVDRVRGNLELAVADRYRTRSDGWLVIDGALSAAPGLAADPRAIGVSKSHSTLPFEGTDLERYLRLPAGHRSSIFAPPQGFGPVYAWALRLWDWTGRDLLYGLIRVEVAPDNGTPEMADRLSRWLLAERAPISAPDRRWDRLLYGIHSVEEYLRATR